MSSDQFVDATEMVYSFDEMDSRDNALFIYCCFFFSWILSLRILRNGSDDQHIYIDHYFKRDSIWILKILTENPAENDLTMFSSGGSFGKLDKLDAQNLLRILTENLY